MYWHFLIYNGHCILGPCIQSEKEQQGLKLKVHVVLKLRDIYIESVKLKSGAIDG